MKVALIPPRKYKTAVYPIISSRLMNREKYLYSCLFVILLKTQRVGTFIRIRKETDALTPLKVSK